MGNSKNERGQMKTGDPGAPENLNGMPHMAGHPSEFFRTFRGDVKDQISSNPTRSAEF